MDTGIHHSDKVLHGAIHSINRNNSLSSNNKTVILEFSDFCLATGLSKVRAAKYIYSLGTIGRILNMDFVAANKNDIMRLMKELNANSDYADYTKKDFKVALKKFYRWLRKTEEYPEEVKFLRTSMKNNTKRLPNEILTVDEVKMLADAADNLRDKAVILGLYESGARVGEFLPLRLKDVEFDQYGCLVMFFGKTGSRRIRLIASSPMIAKWLNIHPDRNNPDAYLWCGQSNTNQGEMLSYVAITRLLRKLGKKSGVKKKLNPHNFRHSRATELSKSLTEAQLCAVFGWELGSDQPATYVHLSQRDTDDALLKIHGLLDEKEENGKQMKVIVCPRCKTKNSPDARFCDSCGMALDIQTALSIKEASDGIDKYLTKILEDKDIQDLIRSKLIGMANNVVK